MFRSAEDVTLVLRLILRLCAGHNHLSHQPLSQVQNWSTATLSPSVSGWQHDKTRHLLQAHPLSDNLACQTGSMTTQYLLQAHPLSDNLACQTRSMTSAAGTPTIWQSCLSDWQHDICCRHTHYLTILPVRLAAWQHNTCCRHAHYLTILPVRLATWQHNSCCRHTHYSTISRLRSGCWRLTPAARKLFGSLDDQECTEASVQRERERERVSIKVNIKERRYALESQYMFCPDSGRDGQGGVTGWPGVPVKDYQSSILPPPPPGWPGSSSRCPPWSSSAPPPTARFAAAAVPSLLAGMWSPREVSLAHCDRKCYII